MIRDLIDVQSDSYLAAENTYLKREMAEQKRVLK
jgi:hypothetical protein